jgi:hypothetical protein
MVLHGKLRTRTRLDKCSKDLAPIRICLPAQHTLFFIHKTQISKNKKATYVRVVCAYRPKKANPKRVRWTARGDRIDYKGPTTTKTADITTAKMLLNSVISTKNGRFVTINLKDFYLCSNLPEFGYVWIPVHMIPQQISKLYKLHDKIVDGHVYAEVRKGMYGLPQARKLANNRLHNFLHPFGYVPCTVTPGLWKDLNSNLMFSLVVDDFGVRYMDKKDVLKLIAVLSTNPPWNGMVPGILDSPLPEIILLATLTYPCLDTSSGPSSASVTQPQPNPSIPRMNGQHPTMAHDNNTYNTTIHQLLMSRTPNVSKKSLGRSCTTDVPSITP